MSLIPPARPQVPMAPPTPRLPAGWSGRERRILIARILAVTADFVQLGLMPLFSPGAFSWLEDALDVAVAIAMIALVGWHWAFLPAFLSELVPVFDLVPTWTAAVLIATRGSANEPPPTSSA